MVKKEISANLKASEAFTSKNFNEEYIQSAHGRVKEKLKGLNKAELILGFEFILDELLSARDLDAYYKQFEEKVELEDLFDPEGIINIENHLGR